MTHPFADRFRALSPETQDTIIRFLERAESPDAKVHLQVAREIRWPSTRYSSDT